MHGSYSTPWFSIPKKRSKCTIFSYCSKKKNSISVAQVRLTALDPFLRSEICRFLAILGTFCLFWHIKMFRSVRGEKIRQNTTRIWVFQGLYGCSMRHVLRSTYLAPSAIPKKGAFSKVRTRSLNYLFSFIYTACAEECPRYHSNLSHFARDRCAAKKRHILVVFKAYLMMTCMAFTGLRDLIDSVPQIRLKIDDFRLKKISLWNMGSNIKMFRSFSWRKNTSKYH